MLVMVANSAMLSIRILGHRFLSWRVKRQASLMKYGQMRRSGQSRMLKMFRATRVASHSVKPAAALPIMMVSIVCNLF